VLHDGELFGRIVAAALLGGLVGWERYVRGQNAGDRTFALVATGAAAFTALGVDAFPNTAEKLIAGIVTGIGFIGGGLLLRAEGGAVRGLTTSTAIWAVAAMAVCAGAGYMVLAIGITVLILFVLEVRYIPVLDRLDARHWVERSRSDSDLDGPDTEPPGL
jgi:putative Mg2+ transporter-C (MgtC) family protein